MKKSLFSLLLVALLTALHPDWTPAEIKSALMLTAYDMLLKEDKTTAADPFDIGAGRIQLELAGLTRPGPFGPRTIELGEYFGCFDGERLVAMAGERMQAGGLREISGVCTHPDFQGRGLARRLVAKLIRRQMERNETPFLHVMRSNDGAHRLYQRMGFRDHLESVVRVVSPC